eukprot:Em0009g882a
MGPRQNDADCGGRNGPYLTRGYSRGSVECGSATVCYQMLYYSQKLTTTTPPSVTICSSSLRPQAVTPPNSAAIAAAIKLDSATPIASTSPNLSPQTQGECDETPDGKLVLSNGWLARWKGRHGVFGVRLHGVAEGADQQGISRARAELPQIITRRRV